MKPRCNKVVVVEGKYDKIRLSSLLDARILTTEGFGLFRNEEKRALLRRLAKDPGLVLFLDPDGAGQLIRSHLHTVTGGKGVTDLYAPTRPGKERRKATPGKAGVLGVEGLDNATILTLFQQAGLLEDEAIAPSPRYTKQDLYRLGYAGTDEAAVRRRAVLKEHELPQDLSANAFLDAVNLLEIQL